VWSPAPGISVATLQRKTHMKLEKYSLGIGDRFGREGKAQLAALEMARKTGIELVPVWNKSHREHSIIGTSPDDTRREADDAVRENGWKHSYYVDADHIGPQSVDLFLASSDFFTIDVADWIGIPPAANEGEEFVRWVHPYLGSIPLPGTSTRLVVSDESVRAFVSKYLLAIGKASEVFGRIAKGKLDGKRIIEVSFDEAEIDQTPEELLLILAGLAQKGIPAQTVAPKFTGQFLKGVDYRGDIEAFSRQFDVDLAVIRFAREHFELPSTLKLSIHSGSDKFSIYPSVRRSVQKHDIGFHLKTSGTTWLEELIGIAEGGGDGLTFAKKLYADALRSYDALVKPYLTVVDITPSRLPSAETVNGWTGGEFAATVRNDVSAPRFNPDVRQLLHVSYKIAAERQAEFFQLLTENRASVEHHVTENLYRRHILPLFQE